MPVVFLALVYTGNAVIAIDGGKTITASDLESIPKINATDIAGFKYISKPKDLQLSELIHMFEMLGLPAGLIVNPSNREAGLAQLLAKVKSVVETAVKAGSRLNGDFSLWGESLLPAGMVAEYQASGKHILDVFSNFPSRFNTVAKLTNFHYSAEEIDQLERDIKNMETVLALDTFRSELQTDVSYMTHLEQIPLGESMAKALADAKDKFRSIRDAIRDDADGEGAAADVKAVLEPVKDQYIKIYTRFLITENLNHELYELFDMCDSVVVESVEDKVQYLLGVEHIWRDR